MTADWDETEVPMDVSSRRLAPVQHRHLPARGLISLLSLLVAFRLSTNRNQAQSSQHGRRGMTAASMGGVA